MIKVWEMVDTSTGTKWYELYDRQSQGNVCNNGYEEVKLPEGYTLGYNDADIPYVYKNGFAYNIHKGKTGYMLYPASVSIDEAYERKLIKYI